jgi:excisionase family DNA binding protein
MPVMKTKPKPFAEVLQDTERRDEITQGGGGGVRITIADAAKLAGVNVETFRRWVREGKLTAFTKPGAGRKLFVDKAQVEKFLQFVPKK